MRILLFTIAGLVMLVALAAYGLMRRGQLSARRVESLFRQPEKPAKPPAPGHYYKRYWS
ncbi:MAG: hypothetical protein ACHP85_05050 [Burkholderiales bacterium]|jgi:hypothetical protein